MMGARGTTVVLACPTIHHSQFTLWIEARQCGTGRCDERRFIEQ